MAGLCLDEAFAFAIEDELAVVDEGHAVGMRELLGTFAYEVNVRTFLEDEACGVNGIAQVLDAGDAAGFHAAAIHEEGVELDAAVGGEKAAASGVEGGVVLKHGHSGFHRVDGRWRRNHAALFGARFLASGGENGCILLESAQFDVAFTSLEERAPSDSTRESYDAGQ